MAETSIQWCDHSINPIRFGKGHYCQKVSPGCANCYASGLQRRFRTPEFGGAGSPLPEIGGVHAGGAAIPLDVLWLDDSKLREVVRRRKPTRYFWCDMTDLFGSWVPDEWIDRCFATMALTPQHTHQVLTKRPERMAAYTGAGPHLPPGVARAIEDQGGDESYTARGGLWPLPNVWLGTSVEDQARADERIPHLLRCQAAVRFLSVEPLLGPIEFSNVSRRSDAVKQLGKRALDGIGWVIIGGESGHDARPMNIAWAKSLVQQCRAAAVPVFVKQDSGPKPSQRGSIPDDLWRLKEFPR